MRIEIMMVGTTAVTSNIMGFSATSIPFAFLTGAFAGVALLTFQKAAKEQLLARHYGKPDRHTIPSKQVSPLVNG